MLRVPYDLDELIVINSQVHQNYKVAIQSRSETVKEEFEEYCRLNLITPEYVYCEDVDEQITAVREGRADMMLDMNMTYVDGMRTIADFAPKPFYFVTTKNENKELMEELNEAILNIQQVNPNFQTELYDKYLAPKNNELMFSSEELEYIKNAPKIKVGYLTDQAPYQYIEEGKPTGICIDFLENISEKTNLQFEYVSRDSYDELNRLVENNEIDILAGMSYDYQIARKNNVSMSQPYVSAHYMAIVNSDYVNDEILDGKVLAMYSSNQYNYQHSGEIQNYDTVYECFKAVSAKKADYTYVDANTAQYYINMPKYKHLKNIPQYLDEREACFGLVKPCDYELLSVLNKSIAHISKGEGRNIVNQNNIKKYNYTIFDIIRENPIPSIFIIFGVSLLIILMLLIFLRQRALINKKNSLELEKHFRLFALLSEFLLEYDFRANILTIYDPAKHGDDYVIKYDFNAEPKNEEHRQSRRNFFEVIRSGSDGIKEVKVWCDDEKYHWFRIAFEIVYEDDKPAHCIGKLYVIDDEKKEKDELIKKSRLDSLTEICNFETTKVLIEEALLELKEGEHGGLLTIDVDYFKNINDTYGHLNGDEVLKNVASFLKRKYGKDGIVGRPGGDEFIVYLRSVKDKDELIKLCDELCNSIKSVKIHGEQGITISVGAILSKYGDEGSILHKKSDDALYKSKNNGRDGFVVE